MHQDGCREAACLKAYNAAHLDHEMSSVRNCKVSTATPITVSITRCWRLTKPNAGPRGGRSVGGDISWQASVGDFARAYGVPSNKHEGAIRLAFLSK
jgi:hypothetical protein